MLEDTSNKYLNVTGNGNVAIPGKIQLIRVIVNTKGGSGNTAQIYNATEADPNSKVGKIDTTDRVVAIEYRLPLLNGLFMVVGGGTTPDLTIVYQEINKF